MARKDITAENQHANAELETEPLFDDVTETGDDEPLEGEVAPFKASSGSSGVVASASDAPQLFNATDDDAGMRLDQYLVSQLPDVSRVRVQQLIEQGKVTVNDRPSKASLRLKGTEQIAVMGDVVPPPLKAVPEDIPLEVVYEDDDFAVVNKPAGMVVHSGAGSTEDARNRGTLVNALLFRFNKLSSLGGDLRPGIVHRLDKDTSGLIVVAKNDRAHRKLADQFATRNVHKRYIALVHNWPGPDQGTIRAPIARDPQNRTRMTTRDPYGRDAVSHYTVLERFTSPYGRFALIEVKIETGRTHQIRVHMASIGHPVVGDTLYGAPNALSPHTLERERQGNPVALRHFAHRKPSAAGATLVLGRNFLHAASLELTHPRTGESLSYHSELPPELVAYLHRLRPPREVKEPEAKQQVNSVPEAAKSPKSTKVQKSSAKRASARKTAATKVHGTTGQKKVSAAGSKSASNKGKQPIRKQTKAVAKAATKKSRSKTKAAATPGKA
ncbi:MAG TPA: RluA family pseudouridine synthase, partial [Terriglobales bacterium]